MTDPFDTVARRAAAGLRAQVERSVDTEVALTTVAAAPRRRPRGRLLAVAASVALLAGTLGVLGSQASDGDRTEGGDLVTIDIDRDLAPAPLALAGPRDGRDSIDLPVTVEPGEGLVDGQQVTVTGSGFVPGEEVGIVMCSRAAGRPDLGGAGAGVEACDIGRFEQVTADAEGVATGTFEVRQALTTPYTGTIDCAAAAEACVVAMGALVDYDRSGGMAITLADDLEPLELPTLEISPAEGLAHGDTVRITGTGWAPHAQTFPTVCSADPSACWDVTGYQGLVADGDGAIDAEVQVWRYLPAMPGTYADCAVSRCLLRSYDEGGSAAAPTVLSFAAGGEPPVAAAVEVTPTTDLVAGDVVEVLGSGFAPGQEVYVNVCAHRPEVVGDEGWGEACSGFEQPGEGDGQWNWLPWSGDRGWRPLRTDDDGRFGFSGPLPDFASGTIQSCLDADCLQVEEVQVDCTSEAWVCDLRVEVWSDHRAGHPPVFAPAPVPLSYRSG